MPIGKLRIASFQLASRILVSHPRERALLSV